MKFIFATNNLNKLEEVQHQCSEELTIIGLKDAGINEDIPETSDTIEGNAIQKAQYIWNNYKLSCFADDTGLCIEALNGDPGVYSARYAGPEKDAKRNMELVLDKLKTEDNRQAFFQTSIALIEDGALTVFTGKVLGRITNDLSGDKGFGYDPIFVPEGHSNTFAQMSMDEKNAISHRGKAVAKLIEYLNRPKT